MPNSFAVRRKIKTRPICILTKDDIRAARDRCHLICNISLPNVFTMPTKLHQEETSRWITKDHYDHLKKGKEKLLLHTNEHKKNHYTQQNELINSEKEFCCTICHKSFKRRHDLKKHRLCHTGEKPFSCEICGRTFSQSSNLWSHVRRHTGVKPFRCKQCGQQFYRKTELRRHFHRHIQDEDALSNGRAN